MVTLGVITTTTSKSPSTAAQTDTREYVLGIVCLALSLLGSGLLGLLQERAFAKYG
jgi:UDP-xylose/UDP-N-acetylglucosamine transporter B4